MSGIDEFLQEQDKEQELPPESTETKETTEEGEVKSDEVKSDEAKSDSSDDKTDDTGVSENKEIKPDIPPENEEIAELRRFIREQRKELAAVRAKLGRLEKGPEVDEEGNPVVKLTKLEELQAEIHNLAVKRTPMLAEIVEVMALNPKYEDIYDVCSKEHFEDMFGFAATNISRSEGKDFNEVLLQLELEVWNKPNPYKYMYSLIKENHPKFAKKEDAPKAKEEVKSEQKQEVKTAQKVLEAQEAPGSIAAAGSGADNKSGGWTAAKIDELDESELHRVPKEIYDKYMLGLLN